MCHNSDSNLMLSFRHLEPLFNTGHETLMFGSPDKLACYSV